MYETLVDTATLNAHLDDPAWRIVDCRFDLGQPGAGREAWLREHIPGAVYAHLEEDLSGPPLTDHGRHPLPGTEALVRTFSRLGIGPATQVIAYDAAGGSMAARLWWLLRYMGHERVAVLDAGWPAWVAAGLPRDRGEQHCQAAAFHGHPRHDRLVRLDEVTQAALLIDSRAPARYRGEVEPIDPVAGHIPGAVNHDWQDNLDAEGRFLSPGALRRALLETLAGTPMETAVFYCGSGVTACHNVLAAAHAGLPEPRLYAGSWSEWCADPERPVATGAG